VPENATAWSDDVAARLTAAGTASLSTALRKRGYHDVVAEGVHGLTPGLRLAGRARTLRLIPFRPDLFASHGGGFNAQKRAFDSLEAGEVLVVEARGITETGTVGDVLALRAQVRGAAGVVTDGGVRDAAALAGMDLPVFSAGRHPVVLGRRHVPWETDVVIACGGAAVVPGDVMVGDDDGVLVIPAALLPEVLADAERQEREDAWIARRVAEGQPVRGLFPMDAEWRVRYDQDPDA
jgi:5-oxopent-3-ene-1,2,5-tricarboxylate decarboxylase / 2-hydroxyhepta-2,4-diene-1,7-dioate isomerase